MRLFRDSPDGSSQSPTIVAERHLPQLFNIERDIPLLPLSITGMSHPGNVGQDLNLNHPTSLHPIFDTPFPR